MWRGIHRQKGMGLPVITIFVQPSLQRPHRTGAATNRPETPGKWRKGFSNLGARTHKPPNQIATRFHQQTPSREKIFPDNSIYFVSQSIVVPLLIAHRRCDRSLHTLSLFGCQSKNEAGQMVWFNCYIFLKFYY